MKQTYKNYSHSMKCTYIVLEAIAELKITAEYSVNIPTAHRKASMKDSSGILHLCK